VKEIAQLSIEKTGISVIAFNLYCRIILHTVRNPGIIFAFSLASSEFIRHQRQIYAIFFGKGLSDDELPGHNRIHL
jgi:hypothetical protein